MERIPRFGTHIPILVKVMTKTRGPVLELGCGISSTPLLFWLCKAQKRRFVSYDNDRRWIRNVGYPCKYVANWDDVKIERTHWSVAFLDHRPGKRRVVDALRLIDKADFIILHDSEPEADKYYQFEKIYPFFKYRFHYTEFLPNTTVLSNLINAKKFMK